MRQGFWEGLIDLVPDFGKGKRKEHCCKDKERSFLARLRRGKGKGRVALCGKDLDSARNNC